MAEGHHGGFWTTLPGLLTGLAALITALTGAAIFLSDNRGGGGDPAPSVAAAPMPSVNNTMAADPQAANEGVPAGPPPAPSAIAADPVAQKVQATALVLNAMMPQQLDAITTRTGISAEGRTIIFHHDVATRTGSDDDVRAFVLAFVCNDPEMREDIDRLGVTYRMSYRFRDSQLPLDIDVTAASCSGSTF